MSTGRQTGPAPTLILGLAMAGAAVLTLQATADLGIFADELQILTDYGNWDASLLEPAGGHLVITSLTIYKGIFELFGADSYLPNRIVHVVMALVAAALVFAVARRRVGDHFALAPAIILLFLGSAAEFTATPFGVLGYGAVIFGLGMVLALEREDRAGDVAACVLLLAGLATYSVNIAFAVYAAVRVFLRWPGGAFDSLTSRDRWRGAWIVIVPVALYTVWRLAYFEPDRTNIAAGNLLEIPGSVFASLATACAAITGLFWVPGPQGPEITTEWGYPLAALFIGLVLWRLLSPPPLDRRYWPWLTALLFFWFLVAANLGPLREPEASRYTYISAVFLLMLMVEMAAGLPRPRWALPALAAAVAVSVLSNAIALDRNAEGFRGAGDALRAQLGAVEIARDQADAEAPVVVVEPVPVQLDLIIPTERYLAAVDEFGSPAYSPAELEEGPEFARAQADVQLIRLLEIGTEPVAAGGAPGEPPRVEAADAATASVTGGCLVMRPNRGAKGTLTATLPPGGFALRAAAGPPVEVALRRFAEITTTPLRGVAGGGAASVAIPTDGSPHPWTAVIGSSQRVELCGIPAAT